MKERLLFLLCIAAMVIAWANSLTLYQHAAQFGDFYRFFRLACLILEGGCILGLLLRASWLRWILFIYPLPMAADLFIALRHGPFTTGISHFIAFGLLNVVVSSEDQRANNGTIRGASYLFVVTLMVVSGALAKVVPRHFGPEPISDVPQVCQSQWKELAALAADNERFTYVVHVTSGVRQIDRALSVPVKRSDRLDVRFEAPDSESLRIVVDQSSPPPEGNGDHHMVEDQTVSLKSWPSWCKAPASRKRRIEPRAIRDQWIEIVGRHVLAGYPEEVKRRILAASREKVDRHLQSCPPPFPQMGCQKLSGTSEKGGLQYRYTVWLAPKETLPIVRASVSQTHLNPRGSPSSSVSDAALVAIEHSGKRTTYLDVPEWVDTAGEKFISDRGFSRTDVACGATEVGDYHCHFAVKAQVGCGSSKIEILVTDPSFGADERRIQFTGSELKAGKATYFSFNSRHLFVPGKYVVHVETSCSSSKSSEAAVNEETCQLRKAAIDGETGGVSSSLYERRMALFKEIRIMPVEDANAFVGLKILSIEKTSIMHERIRLRDGDVLTAVNGKRIPDSSHGFDLLNAVAQSKVGDHLFIEGLRNGQPFAVRCNID